MKGNRVENKKGKGTSVLAFFLGLFLGIIIMLGGLTGGIFLLLNADLDKVLSVAGLDNGADSNGDQPYINTDKDDGGVTNLLELLSRLSVMAGDYKNLTLGEIEDLMPVTRGVVSSLILPLTKHARVTYEELRDVKIVDLGDYIDDAIMSLTVNELYYEDVYKLTVYVDEDGDGKADPGKFIDENKSQSAKLRVATASLEDIPKLYLDEYEVFNPEYLYYVEVDGEYKLVNWDNETVEETATGDSKSNLGKLTELPDDGVTYYTYGQTQSMWRLLLTDKIEVDGTVIYDERALELRDVGKLVREASLKLTTATLKELDDAGILDFTDAALIKPVEGGVFGDLTLDEALQLLADML